MIAPQRWMQHERCPHCGAREFGECLKPQECVLDDPELQAKYDRLFSQAHGLLDAAPAALAALRRHTTDKPRNAWRRLPLWLRNTIALIACFLLACVLWSPWL